MITCTKCGLEKEDEEFCKRLAKANGRYSYCRKCGNAADAENHQKNPAGYLRRNNKWRRDQKQKCIEYKGGKCVLCSASGLHPASYDFHHRNPEEKDFNIGGPNGRPFASLILELDKCDLMCRNCHSAFHAKY
jgi:hypothetical protein